MSTLHDSDDDIRSLLAAYALDAVDDVERRAVERLVATDPDAARELADWRATAAELGAAVAVQPPTGLRERVLADVARTPQARPRSTSASASAHRSTARGRRSTGPVTRLNRLSLAVAAAAVVAVAVPGVVAWQSTERAAEAEAEARALTDVLADPTSQVVRADVAGGGTAVAVLGSRDAVLLADGLPELEGDRVYQLWALRDGAALPVDLLQVRDGQVRTVADVYRPGDGLAVTVEPAGGSEQPTSEPVVVLVQS